MPRDPEPGLVQVGAATIPSGPEAPFVARAIVTGWLDGRGDAHFRDDIRRLVSELVTNSVRHADRPTGAPVHIRAAAVDGVVRIEVEDHGHGLVRRRAPDLTGSLGGGLGLYLVERLAARWGVNHEHGTRVWFELAVRAPES